MIVRRVNCTLLLVALQSLFITIARADDDVLPISDLSRDAMKQFESRVQALRREGKNDEADRLEIELGQAVQRATGIKPLSLSEGEPLPVPDMTRVPQSTRPIVPPSSIPKELRVKHLKAAAASLRAAGMDDDAARYMRMAVQLAQESSPGEIAELRRQLDDCRAQIQELRSEVERLRGQVEQGKTPSLPGATFAPLPGPSVTFPSPTGPGPTPPLKR